MSDQPRETVCLYLFPADRTPSEVWMRKAARHYGSARGQHWTEDDLQIQRTPRGKPYFANIPQLHMSLTHSGSYCVVGLAPCAVGVDLQTHDRFHNESAQDAQTRYLRLAKRFFHPEEYAFVAADPVDRFFALWCAKESYVKYTGTGLDDSLWTYSLLPEGSAEPSNWVAQNAHFRSLALFEGYSFCLCSQRKLDVQILSFLAEATA